MKNKILLLGIYTDNKIKQNVRYLCAEGNYNLPTLHLPVSF